MCGMSSSPKRVRMRMRARGTSIMSGRAASENSLALITNYYNTKKEENTLYTGSDRSVIPTDIRDCAQTKKRAVFRQLLLY